MGLYTANICAGAKVKTLIPMTLGPTVRNPNERLVQLVNILKMLMIIITNCNNKNR